MISFKSLIVTGSLSLLTLAAWADPPKVIERWIHNEQKVNFTGSGPNPAMNYEFTPEAGQIFNIEGVWVDADQVEVSFDKESAPEFLEKKFFRIKDGKKQVLFVYHLQTPEYYHGLTQGRKADVKLPVTPSASVRSLFTWDDKPQQEAFFTFDPGC